MYNELIDGLLYVVICYKGNLNVFFINLLDILDYIYFFLNVNNLLLNVFYMVVSNLFVFCSCNC